MIDWVDVMCRRWGHQSKKGGNPYPQTSPQAGIRDHQGGGKGSFTVNQFQQESYTGDGLAIHIALKGDMTTGQHAAPETIQTICYVHYCLPGKAKTKAKRLEISVPTYWNYLDRAHYWIAGRVPEKENTKKPCTVYTNKVYKPAI